MDHFLGYFLPRLAERVPECAAIVEAIAEGYKICHPGRLDGIHSGLILGYNTLNSPYHNILNESPSVNSEPAEKCTVLHNLASLLDKSDDTLNNYLSAVYTSDMTTACNAIYSAINYAMFRDALHNDSDTTIYTKIMDNETIIIDFRNANHYTNPNNLVTRSDNGDIVPKNDAGYHLSVVSNNVEKRNADTERIKEEKLANGASQASVRNVSRRNGTRFRARPPIDRVELVLNPERFYNKPELVQSLLLALLRIVMLTSYKPDKITGIVNANINQYVDTNDAVRVHVVRKED